MTYDDDAKALVDQFGVSPPQFAALISDVKRMSPDGELMKILVGAGYNVDDLPSWWGQAWRSANENSLPDTDADAGDAEEDGDDAKNATSNVVLPKETQPKERVNLGQRTTSVAQRSVA